MVGAMKFHIYGKKIHFVLFTGLFLTLLFAGCSMAHDENLEDTLPDNVEYIELTDSTVSLSDILGKKIYLVTVNTSSQKGESRRYVTEFDNSYNLREIKAESPKQLLSEREFENLFYDQHDSCILERIEPQIHVDLQSEFQCTRSTDDDSDPFELHAPIDYQIGDTREMYVGTGPDPNYTEEAVATLVYKSDICNVWVCNDYLAENEPAGGNKVDASICKKLATILEQAILLERNIVGRESDYLTDADNMAYSMAECSPTGTKINILLYDIKSDYSESQSSGILGFFTRGDYFPWKQIYNTTSHSNGGKFLHIDSGFANNFPGDTQSTVVHEFQHMIHNGMFRAKGKVSETWYDEMCSMLAEDLLQKKLGLADKEVGKYRFNHLMFSYRTFPFFKWDTLDSNATAMSYANAYGLGYIISKKYGGPDFIYELTHNASSGTLDGFLETVRCHNSLATKESILRDIAIEMVTGLYSNRDVVSTAHVMNDYTYPMTAFDLLNFDWVSSGKQYKGPHYKSVYKNPTAAEASPLILEPNQFSIASLGTSPVDDLDLEFYGEVSPDIKEYILIVD